MNFYPTLPPQLAVRCDKGSHHFVQAHVLEMFGEDHPGVKWYQMLSEDTGHDVILDNGAWELGKGNVELTLKWAEIIRPDCVIVPDAFCKNAETMSMASKLIDKCRKLSRYRVMLVPQGAGLYDWAECAGDMVKLAYAHGLSFNDFQIGLPKVLESFESGGRLKALLYLQEMDLVPVWGCHLLGTWKGLWEADTFGHGGYPVLGLDTTLPLAYVIHRAPIGPYMPKEPFDPAWWDIELERSREFQLILNIAWCRRMVEHAGGI